MSLAEFEGGKYAGGGRSFCLTFCQKLLVGFLFVSVDFFLQAESSKYFVSLLILYGVRLVKFIHLKTITTRSAWAVGWCSWNVTEFLKKRRPFRVTVPYKTGWSYPAILRRIVSHADHRLIIKPCNLLLINCRSTGWSFKGPYLLLFKAYVWDYTKVVCKKAFDAKDAGRTKNSVKN